MITIVSMEDMFSPKSFSSWNAYYLSREHAVLDYIASAKGDYRNLFAVATRIQLLNTLIANGDKPFYASDLFGSSDSLGGWMNGLDLAGIIISTGNTRTSMVEVKENVFRKCEVKEWKLRDSADFLRDIIDRYKAQFVALW